MNSGKTLVPFDVNDEIPGLIETLHRTELRLEELTRGEVDTVASGSGQPILLRHAQEELRHSAAVRQAAILNALPAHIALVDTQGVILSVNEAWRRFGKMNVIETPVHCIGLNYLEICDRARGAGAAQAADAATGIRAVLAGETNSFSIEYPCHAPGEQRWFLMMVTPLADDHPNGAVVMHVNITERRRVEQALHESEARLHLLNNLGEATRALVEPAQIMAVMTRLLGEHLHASRCAYADVDPDGEQFTILHDYTDHSASTVGSYRLSLFGPRSVSTLRSGQTLVVRDVDAELLPEEGADMFNAIGIKAIITCPLVKEGGLRALMAVHQSTPRNWTPDEIALVKEVVERCWVTLERRTAVVELRASEENFRTLSEAVPQIVWVAGPDGGSIYFNQRWMDYTGLTLAESLAHGWSTPCHPDDRERVRDAWQEALRTGGTYTIECRLRRADGIHHWWLIRGAPLRDAAGGILKWFGTCTDIDEFKQAQTRIAEQAALIDQARDAILVRDLDDRIIFWNHGAGQLFGWTEAEALGRDAGELLRPELEKFHEARTGVLRDGAWSGEIKKTAKDGTALTLDARWTLLCDPQGRPKSILSIDTDITERKQIELQFLRAQRMESIGTLAGGIAHDLNNLLAPITMGVGILKLFETSPRSVMVIDTIERSAMRGADLVKQVLSFARGVEGARVPVQIGDLIRDVMSITQSTFPKNINVEMNLPDDLWPVLGDASQLNQVVLNLCVNARDAMPKGGHLQLAAQNIEIDAQYAVMNRGVAAGRYVVIKVTDNGSGIPKEVVDRIFEPFFTTKEVGKGTGLGLSTVLGIVRSHGGFVNVHSEPNKGSVFSAYLPAMADGGGINPSEQTDEKLPRGNGELILVVDDESTIRDITQETLQTFGYTVITSEDGARATSLFAQRRHEIAAVLTDMMMPVMDGPALISALRHINPHVRIIATSGLSTKTELARVAEAGVLHFIPKPYSADTLLLKLKAVLAEKPAGDGTRPPV